MNRNDRPLSFRRYRFARTCHTASRARTRFDLFRFAGEKGAIELFVAAGRGVDP